MARLLKVPLKMSVQRGVIGQDAGVRLPFPCFRAWLIAGGFFIGWLLVILAGSDIPPPRGFAWIVVGLVVICTAIAFALSWLWRVRGVRGLLSVLWRTTTIGALTGLALAAIFAARGQGEPSIPPMNAADYAIWFSVLTVVGAVNGVIIGVVASLARPRRSAN